MKQENKGSKNLIPFSKRTEDEQREIRAKGGKNSGASRRKKKALVETFRDILDLKIKKGSALDKTLSEKGIELDKNADIQTAMIAGIVASAARGNVNAYYAAKEALDECNGADGDAFPAVKIPAELICGKYADINRHISNGTVKEAILKGGRGGWKSSYPGLKIPELMMSNPSVHALCVRNVKDTLKDSVFEQIKWGIEKLGVADRFKCTTSPLKIVYKPTGQTIYFRGADDPIKIKSIKPPFGYIGVVWFEEFDQYAGEAAIRNMRQSAIRGTDETGKSSAIVFESFNPPPTAQAWVNRYVADIEARSNDPEKCKQGTEILHTTYKDVPREWLGDDFIQEAEELKKHNPRAYANEYGGEITGTGGNVFKNLEIRDLSNEEVENFDRVKQGLDWGYFPDPTAFVRLHYDAARMTIYIFDELKRVKTGNEDLTELLKRYKNDLTIADNAEEKSIAFFRENGFNIRACVKGPGSVDYGIKWLASRAKIVIDRKRCPETAREFESYEYLKDKDGNFISGYPDKDNHFIDAVRYALNDEIMIACARVKNMRY